MDNAPGVGMLQRPGDLMGGSARGRDSERLTQALPEGAPVHALHHEIYEVFDLTRIVHSNNVGVVELSDYLHFTREASHEAHLILGVIGQDFDRHIPVHRSLVCLVDTRRTAPSELLDNLVGADMR